MLQELMRMWKLKEAPAYDPTKPEMEVLTDGEGLTPYSKDAIYAALLSRLANKQRTQGSGIEGLLALLRKGKGGAETPERKMGTGTYENRM